MEATSRDMAQMECEIRDLISQLEAKDRDIFEHKESRKTLEQVRTRLICFK